LFRRMAQHKSGAIPGFARKYGIDRLVYLEATISARDAIAREKTDQRLAPVQENRTD
jgi:putative endonuclease